MHLRWGADQADRLGLPTFLEGSKTGQPLYERCGFEPLSLWPFDSTLYGSPENIEHTVMRRPPKAVNRQSSSNTR